MEEKPTYYIDSNVLVYASTNNQELGQKARRFLQAIQAGTFRGVTSCLTFDEVIYVLKKILPANLLAAGEQILDLDIKFIPVDKQLLHALLNIVEASHLQPRDALHLATMRANNVSLLVSEDKDFDTIPTIKRQSLLTLKI